MQRFKETGTGNDQQGQQRHQDTQESPKAKLQRLQREHGYNQPSQQDKDRAESLLKDLVKKPIEIPQSVYDAFMLRGNSHGGGLQDLSTRLAEVDKQDNQALEERALRELGINDPSKASDNAHQQGIHGRFEAGEDVDSLMKKERANIGKIRDDIRREREKWSKMEPRAEDDSGND